MTRSQLLDALSSLLPAQFDLLLAKLDVPVQLLSGGQAPLATRATELLRYADQQNLVLEVERVLTEVRGRAEGRVEPPIFELTHAELSDRHVLDVVARLRRVQQTQGVELVSRRELFQELDRLFNRMTFRFEPLRACPEQRWADRLDCAYQTERVLWDWERNVREVAKDKHRTYIELLKEVGSYRMQMGALLFDPAVDYNRVKDHIGRATFKAQLPPEVRFPAGRDKQPRIPNATNDRIERHRTRAVELMDELSKE